MTSASRTIRRLSRRVPTSRPTLRRLLLETLENRSLLAAIAPPDGIVSWWTADNTATDLVGPNNATLLNGGGYVAGQVASGFNFDGIDDNLQAPTVGLPTGSADRTIELWARIDQQVAGESFFASYGAPGVSNQAYAIGTQSSGRLFVSTWGPAVFGPTLQNNRWYHVAATNVGTSFKLYLDGVEVAADIMPVNTPAGSTFWMGRQTMTTLGDSRRLDGKVDEVTVYDRALSGAEIQAIYNAGSDGKIKSGDYIAADFPSVVEGAAGSTSIVTFTINRVGNPAGEATVNWTTADGSATGGADYLTAADQVVFQDGQSQQTITVTVKGDDTKEPKESFNLVLSAVTPGYATSGGQATILNDDFVGLVSHWTANSTAADATGTNNGALISGATYAAGQVGQAFSFDGVDDRVQVADSASLKLTESMTIEGWVKATSLPVQQSEILFRGDDRGGLDPYSLSVQSNGSLRFEVSSLGGAMSVSTPMPLGQFVYVVGTLDDATGALQLYLNGVLMSQTVTGIRPFGDLDPASNPGIGIGNHGGFPTTPHNFPFNGLIDELKVYDVSLTGAQVLANFNATKGSLQPAISISDATATEGNSVMSFRDIFVPAGSGGLATARGITLHADSTGKQYLYVTSTGSDEILRFDGISGSFDRVFVSAGSGGLDGPQNVVFGSDGNAYVTSYNTNEVMRYDPTGNPLPASGKPGAVFVGQAGGLNWPIDMVFKDGNLLVSCEASHQILRYDPAGNSLPGPLGAPGTAEFVPANSGGLRTPKGLTFGPDGQLYVTARELNSVMRFDGVTGAPRPGPSAASGTAEFVPSAGSGINVSQDVEFAPDGTLYVSSTFGDEVRHYQGPAGGSPGAFIDAPISPSLGGLLKPIGLQFDSAGDLLVASRDNNNVVRYQQALQIAFTVSLSAPNPTEVSVGYATIPGTAGAGDYVSASGTLVFAPGETKKAILVPTIDNNTTIELNETFTVNLSSAVGSDIADGTGVGTIIDNDTKFYVVNDGTSTSTDRTFEYGSGTSAGFQNYTAGENYGVNSGNSAPRGAASTAAGDKVWVVDANRNVYVYTASGGLIGTWTAGSLNAASQIEGIATNGTDVWIVDAKSDKVYRYTAAASRISGSQNAASNFSLNKSNTNPKDIVTDGTYLWVVDDASADKVFKYTLFDNIPLPNKPAGTLVATWTISTVGASMPTGITLDPSNPNDIWIVDAGAKRVYQYNNAVNQANNSSKAADFVFALAAGNTNPQGIADPPVSTLTRSDSEASPVTDSSFDSALLTVLGELDGLLPGGKKRK